MAHNLSVKRSMETDKEVCEKMAELWVSLGGDVDGFDYCASRIREEIKEKYAKT